MFFTKQLPLSNHRQALFVFQGRTFCVGQYLAFVKTTLLQNKVLAKQDFGTKGACGVQSYSQELAERHKGEVGGPGAGTHPTSNQGRVQSKRLISKVSNGDPPVSNWGGFNRHYVGCWPSPRRIPDQDVLDTAKLEHQGNLLGYTLEQVRDELKRAFKNPSNTF